MYSIIRKRKLAEDTYLMEIEAPRIAKSALPGQFVIVKTTERGERIPLTIVDYDRDKCITLIFKAIGLSTREMASMGEGDSFKDVVGPLGRASNLVSLTDNELADYRVAFVAGGIGIAPVYPQVKWLYEHGNRPVVIAGAKTKSLLFYTDELKEISDLHVVTDDESYGMKGMVTDCLRNILEKGVRYDEIVAVGPMIMMKFVVELAREFSIPCTVSLNSLMVDGTGMCGACRVTIGGKTKFTCVDGPEFDGYAVDFAEAMKRQAMYDTIEGRKRIEDEETREGHVCFVGGVDNDEPDRRIQVPMREQPADERIKNFREVALGYNAEEAIQEAKRCLQCRKPQCVKGCPVHIDIPEFIRYVAQGDFKQAAFVINKNSALPAVYGRVCPQETQCEGECVSGRKFDTIGIGKLERFVGDWARENNIEFDVPQEKNGHKVAVVGSGPAGLTCAKELLVKGYDVTVFEALHELGGVLAYGIPSFRLPKETVVYHEIENLRKLGAKFERNVIVGKTITIDQLIDNEGFSAVFIGSGAGLPNFMHIHGENLCGVVSANEFLTRNNLLFAYKEGYVTPNYIGKRVAIIGGGNVDMDAARTAVRLGAEVTVVYRRSEEELPARHEEVQHAKEEGIGFNLLCNPVEILGDEKGWVKAMRCVRMQLGEPDISGRRRPVPVPDSDFTLDVDMVILAVGTSPNPIISSNTPGLNTDSWGSLVADEETGQTTREGVFAAGDAVSGSATVIMAMGGAKKAAAAIDKYVREKLGASR